ncbi:MAG: tRNA (N6-threonylcarbamoyladenosine(37)-N6)-methyltransferase TrmO [Promethearchaeota archaeon]
MKNNKKKKINALNKIEYRPIGIIHSPYKEAVGTPIQPKFDEGSEGIVEIFEEYKEGLSDLDMFSHIILIFHFHKTKGYVLKTRPYLEENERGIFAVRGPRRPNPIGLSIVKLERIENNKIYVKNLDLLDGTPILDIKPYIRFFDIIENSKAGWLENHSEKILKKHKIKADNRFHKN